MTKSENYTLITGATGGIGRELVNRIALTKPVLIAGRSESELDELANTCQNDAATWVVDFTDVVGVQSSFESRLNELDSFVDGFVHCAGVVSVSPSRLLNAESVLNAFNVNVISAQLIMSSLCKKRLNNNELTAAVFVSSIYAIRGVKGQSVYSATKSALCGMMRSLAVELSPRTRVNAVLPGGVRTGMSERAFSDPKTLSAMNSEYLLRMGRVTDIVDAVLFLLSDEAGWITGQEIVVDGGKTLR